MRTTTWIILGLALNGAAAVLHGPDMLPAADLAQNLPHHLPRLLLLAAGQFCLFRAFRSAFGDLWKAFWGGKHKGADAAKPSALKTFEEPEPLSHFDADEAFARYMERRKAADAGEAQDAPMPSPAARARAASGFGRKVV